MRYFFKYIFCENRPLSEKSDMSVKTCCKVSNGNLKRTKQLRRLAEIHVTRKFFEASGARRYFLENTNKNLFGYGIGECVYRILDLYSYWLVQGIRHK